MKRHFGKLTKTSALLLLALVSIVPAIAFAEKNTSYETAVIYYNEACTMCAMYINQELVPLLMEAGVQNIVKKDYVNEKQNRVELNRLNEKHKIPPNLQGHFMVFIDNRIILGGHVPKHVIRDLLAGDLEFDKILVLQDSMGDAKSYIAWGFKGEAKGYGINTPISRYIEWFNENKDLMKTTDYSSYWSFGRLFPLVAISGFLDGLNPCAFAVLIFFVVFLFTMQRAAKDIIKVGIIYIAAIYIAYLLIGLGIVHAFIFSGQEHLMAKISAYLVIFLGLVNIKDYFWYGKWFSLSPRISAATYKRWIQKLTLPSTFIAGFLVGLCTFPCSGGIYVAIIGLLVAKTTYLSGLYYILFYNFMFVLPLIITLLFLTNRRTLGHISRWESSHKRELKLATGIVMVLLGIVILAWFI
jgi:cytochrome c biogenesis protein CcdA